jgi:hypothetical protein
MSPVSLEVTQGKKGNSQSIISSIATLLVANVCSESLPTFKRTRWLSLVHLPTHALYETKVSEKPPHLRRGSVRRKARAAISA